MAQRLQPAHGMHLARLSKQTVPVLQHPQGALGLLLVIMPNHLLQPPHSIDIVPQQTMVPLTMQPSTVVPLRLQDTTFPDWDGLFDVIALGNNEHLGVPSELHPSLELWRMSEGKPDSLRCERTVSSLCSDQHEVGLDSHSLTEHYKLPWV